MGRILLPGQARTNLPNTPRSVGQHLLLPGQAEPEDLATAEARMGRCRIILPGEEHTPVLSIPQQLDEIEALALIYSDGGTIHYESVVESRYPQINVPTLCVCLEDALMDWPKAKHDYLDRHGKAIEV